MSKVLSVRVADDLGEWVDEYAKERGVSRQDLLENAVVGFREDCQSGVPELRSNLRALRRAQAPKAGECACPTFPDGVVGFKSSCPVHGRKTREQFNAAVSDRSDLFKGLTAPESVRFGVKREK